MLDRQIVEASGIGRTASRVLLDLRLPDSGDLRILAAMRQLSPEVPVILMTAFGTPDLLDDALRLGAFAVIDKPFDMSAISPLIERALAA
jgi:DNA-binding NtrC family response regulator